MKQHHIIDLMQDGYTTVKCVFPGSGRPYTYKALNGAVEVGDICVIVGPENNLKLVEVVQVDDYPDIDTDSNIKYKWIVQKVDLTLYKQLRDQEQEALKLLREVEWKGKQKELKDRLKAEGITASSVKRLGETLKVDKES